MVWQEIEQHLKHYQPNPQNFPNTLKEAAVLIPILKKDKPEIVLTLRSNELSTHQGEVAFPGGKRDASDKDLLQTALRETYEEIALVPDNVKIVGSLQSLVSKHCLMVKPYVGLVNDLFTYRVNADEIAHVFTVPLDFFKTPPHTFTHRIDCFGMHWYVPCYQYQQFKIWGLTASIIVELVNLLFGMHVSLHNRPEHASLIKL